MSRILIVEDDSFFGNLITEILQESGHHFILVGDAEKCWPVLLEGNIDAVLLDRILPDMDGLNLLRQIKADPNLKHIPVIVQTSMGDNQNIQEGLAAGAYYYLTKPLVPKTLLAVIDAALKCSKEQAELQTAVSETSQALSLLKSGSFRYQSIDEANALALGLARACPDPGRVVLGLKELLINAVEHGNLGLSYHDKTRLMMDGGWRAEIDRRENDPKFGNRWVTVDFSRRSGTLFITIADEGHGFDWRQYLDFSPERALDPHGRGIAMARLMSFDDLRYIGRGNVVIVTINESKPGNDKPAKAACNSASLQPGA